MKTRLTQVWLAGPEAAGGVERTRFSEADRGRAERLVGSAKEAEWLASRVLLQQVASAPHSATSRSHSAGYAALAAGPLGVRIGVDLESVKWREVMRLARFSFAPEEASQIAALAPNDALLAFYLRWTLKEACAKALGLPLLQALRECQFMAEGNGWRASIPCDEPWAAATWLPRPGFVLSCALFGADAGDDFTWDVREWPSRDCASWPRVLSIRSGDQRLAIQPQASSI